MSFRRNWLPPGTLSPFRFHSDKRRTMPETLNLPYYTIEPKDLARWLDAQVDTWWTVDGDPLLTSQVDFPCPAEELSAELLRVNKPLRVFDPRKGAQVRGGIVAIEQLDEIADTANKAHARTYLLSWEGDANQWLLAEDPEAANVSA